MSKEIGETSKADVLTWFLSLYVVGLVGLAYFVFSGSFFLHQDISSIGVNLGLVRDTSFFTLLPSENSMVVIIACLATWFFVTESENNFLRGGIIIIGNMLLVVALIATVGPFDFVLFNTLVGLISGYRIARLYSTPRGVMVVWIFGITNAAVFELMTGTSAGVDRGILYALSAYVFAYFFRNIFPAGFRAVFMR